MEIDQRKAGFINKFGDGGDIRGYFAPGRVNLIGEHIDYNGGHVFPCALSVGTYCIARKRNDNSILLYSDNCKRAGVRKASIDDIQYIKQNGWINYPLGVIWAFGLKGRKVTCGLDLFFYGNIIERPPKIPADRLDIILTQLLLLRCLFRSQTFIL